MTTTIRTSVITVIALVLAAATVTGQTGNVWETTTPLASAARTVTATSAAQEHRARGVRLTLDVTAVSGTNPTLDVKLQGQDPVSGQWTDVSGAVFQRITGTGTRTLTVYPSSEGPGHIRSITGTDPAAGVEWSETVPTNARWRLISVKADLVTDATVANRTPLLVLDDGALTNELFRSGHATSQTAGTTWRNQWADIGLAHTVSAMSVASPLPNHLFLSGGYRVRSQTGLFAAGDNWSAPQLLVEEWIGNHAGTVLPSLWRVVATIGGSSPSFTFSVGGSYLP